MSKQTKIIAIAGGVLILLGVIYIAVSPGGFKGAFGAMGCGKAEKRKGRQQLDAKSMEFNDCRAYGFVTVRDPKTMVQKKNGKKPVQAEGKGEMYCLKLWNTKCEDAAFKSKNKRGCKKFSEILKKKGGGGDGDGDDDDDDD